MELIEQIKDINIYLQREFGTEPDGTPRWRVIFSEDMTEKRLMTHTDEGFELINPEVREVKKYQHIKEKYVLERQVPVIGETDLVTKTSYEPAWTFEDRHGNYLPPRFDACKFIIEAIFAQMDKAGTHTKYKDEKSTVEAREKAILEMEQMLFGNETLIGDALAHKFGITVPEMPTISEQKEEK